MTDGPGDPGADRRPARGPRAADRRPARFERVVLDGRARLADHRREALAVAAAGFAVLAFFSVRTYVRLHLHPDPLLLVAACALALPAIGLNALEFAVAARVAGQRVDGRRAVTVSVAGSAANLLPLPGAALVRSAVLVSGGAALATAAGALLSVAAVWVGVTAAAMGAVTFGRSGAAAAALVVAGLVVTLAGVGGAARRLARAGEGRVWALGVVVVEVATVTLDTVRIWLVLRALGVHATAVQSFALTAANVLATVTGLLPGGLGLREALSALFGAATGLPAGVAVTAAATDRIGVLLVVAAASAGVALAGRHHRPAGGMPLAAPAEPGG